LQYKERRAAVAGSRELDNTMASSVKTGSKKERGGRRQRKRKRKRKREFAERVNRERYLEIRTTGGRACGPVFLGSVRSYGANMVNT